MTYHSTGYIDCKPVIVEQDADGFMARFEQGDTNQRGYGDTPHAAFDDLASIYELEFNA